MTYHVNDHEESDNDLYYLGPSSTHQGSSMGAPGSQPTNKGQYIAQISQVLQIYKSLPEKKYKRDRDYYQLFITLHRYWEATNEKTISLSELGALFRAQDPFILLKFPQPQLTSFLKKAVKLGFPIKCKSKQSTVDFQSLREAITFQEISDEVSRDIIAGKNDEDASF